MRSRFVIIGFLALLSSHRVWAEDVSLRSLKDGMVVVDLDEPYSQCCAGGGGRYLIFHLKQAKKLVLFDIQQAAVIKSMEAPSDDVMIAAGADKMILVIPGSKLIHRYSLPDLVREKTATWTDEIAPRIVLLGCASQGPLILWGDGPVALWDLDNLRPLALRGDLASGEAMHGFGMSVSADGQTLCSWLGGISGQPLYAYHLSGNILTRIKTPDVMNGASWMKSNADGSLFIRGGSDLADNNLKPIASNNFRFLAMQPTEDPRFFVGASYPNQPGGEQVWICSTGSLEKIVGVSGGGSIRYNSAGGWDGYFGNESRMRFLPKAGLMATLPKGDRQIRVMPANLETLLKEKGGAYLHLISVPLKSATVGKRYAYQLETLTNLSPINFSVETGPDGMTVDKEGNVEWTPNTRPIGGITQVIIAARSDNGKEVFQSFAINVERGDLMAPASAPGKGVAAGTPKSLPNSAKSPTAKSSPKPQAQPKPDMATESPANSNSRDEPVQIDDHRIELASGDYLLTPGLGHKSLLLLQGDRLTVLGADGITIQKTTKLPKRYLRIAERADYWVGITDKPFAAEILRKDTFEVIRSVKFSGMEVTDLALHPSLPVAYVACKTSVDIPSNRFYVVDESKAEAHESEEFVGKWLQIDPRGQFLLAGYSDIYERGTQLIMNPDRWHFVPEYGSLDLLIRYDLDHEGQPRLGAVKTKAGGNGKGIRLSPDGKRVSYLSVVGSPAHSGNLTGWDPMDLSKVPAIYGTSGKASTEHLAYHPFLPLAASCSAEHGVVLFQRESGDEQSDKLTLPADEFDQAKLQEVYFSPDGQRLLLETTVNAIRYFQSVKLSLKPNEERTNSKAWSALSGGISSTMDGDRAKVTLRQLDALGGGTGKEMTAKDIGRAFMNSVVVVQSDGESGSGFVVGSEGYIVTCEHCIPPSGEVRVLYRVPTPGRPLTKTAVATTVKTDRPHDLALLKITAGKLPPVRLGSNSGLESGARVTAISNPGVAKTILDFTMTDGIVSNPQRELGGRKYIQTNATFNRGSSGGPLFDDHGAVVGMIAAKADIEATGFVIPVLEIVEFLVHAAEKPGKQTGLRRQWRDASDQFSIDAQLVETTADTVKLVTPDGREVSMDKSRLSKLDQELIQFFSSAP